MESTGTSNDDGRVGICLRRMLQQNASLQVLDIDGKLTFQDATQLDHGIRRNSALAKLGFRVCGLGDESLALILEGIRKSKSCLIEHLIIQNCYNLTDASVRPALEATTAITKNLRRLSFLFNQQMFGTIEPWTLLEHFLVEHNSESTSLRELDLFLCGPASQPTFDGTRAMIRALERNTFLKSLTFNVTDGRALMQLASSVPLMNSLEKVTIRVAFHNESETISDECDELVCQAFEKNSSIFSATFIDRIDYKLKESTKQKIYFFAKRNRLNELVKSRWKSSCSFPNSLWPSVLVNVRANEHQGWRNKKTRLRERVGYEGLEAAHFEKEDASVGLSAMFHALRTHPSSIIPVRCGGKRRAKDDPVADEE